MFYILQLAFKYLGCVLFPLFICYAIYSITYLEHKGWYSFILSMSYGFLLTFGKSFMTSYIYFLPLIFTPYICSLLFVPYIYPLYIFHFIFFIPYTYPLLYLLLIFLYLPLRVYHHDTTTVHQLQAEVCGPSALEDAYLQGSQHFH